MKRRDFIKGSLLAVTALLPFKALAKPSVVIKNLPASATLEYNGDEWERLAFKAGQEHRERLEKEIDLYPWQKKSIKEIGMIDGHYFVTDGKSICFQAPEEHKIINPRMF